MGEPEDVYYRQFVPKKYILREDKVGRFQLPKKRLSSMKRNLPEIVTNTAYVYQALRGDLFQQLGHDRQPFDPHMIAVKSIEHDNRELETETTVFSEISEEVAELLLSVRSSIERYQIFASGHSIDRALNIKLKEHVIVKTRGGKEQHGILRYRGRLIKEKGTYFGVQLQEPNGNSDGSINGFKYFDCPTNHGIFVSFDQIIFTDQKVQGIADSTKRKKGIKNVLGNQVNPALGAVESYGNLELGMRVIAFAENKTGKEQILRGVIRYLGYPPKAQEILAGIELIRIFDLACEGDAAIAAAIKPGPIFTNAAFENCLWTTVEDKPIL